jgi:assimilatory nitrate reductase catalytic subunit
MEVKALVVPTIRPDTLFIPFHYGHEQAVNQLTNPAVDPTVKIPEYKVCAARLERLDAPPPPAANGAAENFTPESAPKMFPYAVGETKTPAAQEGKAH